MTQLRETILQSSTCTFSANVSADYGDQIHNFQLKCQSNSVGSLMFEVTYPETISGITGSIDNQSGSVTFDDHVLAFEPMTDRNIAPVISPWIFIKSLRSGYVRSCSDDEQMMLILDDTYETEPLRLHVWINGDIEPCFAEIYWKGQRVISIEILDFTVV